MKLELLYTAGRFLRTLYDRFFEDGCTYRSAALTYTTLLSLVPLMTVSFAIFSAFPVFSHISMQIQNFIFSHFVAASGEVIQNYLQKFVLQTKNLSAIGSGFLVVTAILMMFTMEQAFNAIWKVASRRKGLSTFLLYWAILTLSPILIGLSIIVSTHISNLPLIAGTAHDVDFLRVLPFLLNLFFFTLLYVLVPNCYVPIKYGFIGAFVSTILFTIAKFGFAYYVSHFPSYVLLYGALATVPLFLVWLYLMWMIILFGVIISNVLATGYRFRSAKKMDGFTHAFIWLGYFWQGLKSGMDISMQELVAADTCGYAVEPNRQLQLLLNGKLICETKAGHYILSAELAELSLQEFANKLPWRFPTQQELSQWQDPWVKNLAACLQQGQNQEKLNTLFKHT